MAEPPAEGYAKLSDITCPGEPGQDRRRSPRSQAEQHAECALGARGVPDPQGSHGRNFHICHGRAFGDATGESGQRLGELAMGGMDEIGAADFAGGRGRGGNRCAEAVEKRAPRGIVTSGAPETCKNADDQVVPGGCQAGTAANQAIERARGPVRLQNPSGTGEARALALDGPGGEFDVMTIDAGSTLLHRTPCRPPRPSDLRTCKVDASGREVVPPGLRRAEVNRQPSAGDSQYVGATSNPLSDRDFA